MGKEKIVYHENFNKYFEINYNLFRKVYDEKDELKEHRMKNGNDENLINDTLIMLAMQTWLMNQWATGIKEFEIDFNNNEVRNSDKYNEINPLALFEINKVLKQEIPTKESFDSLSKYFNSWAFTDVPSYLVSSLITKMHLFYLKQLTEVYKFSNETYTELLENKKSNVELLAAKNLNLKKLNETLKIIKVLEKKIIKPVSYDVNGLAEYYIKCFLTKRGKPSLRDLEKGSDYNKDKWSKEILNNAEFLILVMHKLKSILLTNPKLEDKINQIRENFLLKYSQLQKLDEANVNKTKGVMSFDENILN